MTDATGTVVWAADYLPFGQADVTMAAIDNNLRFSGQYFDQETGLHYNYWRFYDPRIGRYLRADPIGLDGGINPYIYVENIPTNSFDSNGLNPYSNANNSGKVHGGSAANVANHFLNFFGQLHQSGKLVRVIQIIQSTIPCGKKELGYICVNSGPPEIVYSVGIGAAIYGPPLRCVSTQFTGTKDCCKK